MAEHNTGSGKEKPGTGNASNPAPHQTGYRHFDQNQVIPGQAEKYLREAGNIEDLPDATDQQDMEETIKKEQGPGPAL